MFRIIAVTNSGLCAGSLSERIKLLVEAGVHSIILREKDYTAAEYRKLAKTALGMTHGTNTILAAHGFIEVAKELGIKNIHLPLGVLQQNPDAAKHFDTVGVSVHSLDEAERAVSLGATCLVAGHIFKTDCKQGLPPRGLAFLSELCNRFALPVYAIGGITEKTIADVKKCGASGACLMSSLMQAENAAAYLKQLMVLSKTD